MNIRYTVKYLQGQQNGDVDSTGEDKQYFINFGVRASTQKQEPHKNIKFIQKMGMWL